MTLLKLPDACAMVRVGYQFLRGASLSCNGSPLEANWFSAPASPHLPQVSDSSGTVKVVFVDSVTAVVSPLLGGQQREGE